MEEEYNNRKKSDEPAVQASEQPVNNEQVGSNTATMSQLQPQTTPQPQVQPQAASSSSSVVNKAMTSVPVATSIPDEFKGSTTQELIDFLEQKVKEYKPLSKEDQAKIRRRQKAEGIISGISDAVMSIANLAATHNYAPNMYNPTEGMSAKAKARFEKEKADREAENDKYFNYALTLANLRNADKDRALNIWQTEQNIARQERAYTDSRNDKAKDDDFRDKNFNRQEEWHKEDQDRWQKQFDEGVRQFNISSANEKARLGMEAQRLSKSMQDGKITFNLGTGYGNVTLSTDKLNAQTVSRIYSTLPEEVRKNIKGDPIVQNGVKVGYKDVSTEAMLIAIGTHVESSPATQNAIRQVAGLETGKKPAGY
ncbi:MAG: hypothetical protein HDS81_00605 [Bacteroidales bacterium]|nr:hypothetical protein [Bacteroidales bacterium]